LASSKASYEFREFQKSDSHHPENINPRANIFLRKDAGTSSNTIYGGGML
jgi:hypothetical protein